MYPPTDAGGAGGKEIERGEEGFALILLPVDVLGRLHGDFSEIVGRHMADRVFYQTGYRCGEVSSFQFKDFDFEGEEKVSILEEMINMSGFGKAEVIQGEKEDMEIRLHDAGEDLPAVKPPGLIFASGFFAGFATALSSVRYRCIWDTPENEDATEGFVLYLAGVRKPGSIRGKSFEDVIKGGI